MPFDGNLADISSFRQSLTKPSHAEQVLEEALRLIRKGWSKHCYAKCWWLPVPYKSLFATRYCALGAIHRAGYNLDLPIHSAIRALGHYGSEGVVFWNDCNSKGAVIAGFEWAIDEVRQRQ